MARPRRADYDIWRPNTGEDTSAYLLDPGSVNSEDNPQPGGLRNPRPYFFNNGVLFVFPVGVEGFTRSGQAQLGLHHYIGDNAVDGVAVHLEEARIELTGTFPGITAQPNMVNCINILRAPKTDENGLVFYAPGVFLMEQRVLAESWEFTHDRDDRTHSIDYTITLVRLGEGKKVKFKHGKAPVPNPTTTKAKPKGKPAHIFTAKDGARTLKAIAKIVYADADMWHKLVDLNEGQTNAWKRNQKDQKLANHQLPTHRWPNGTQFRY